jgi:protein SCO1/2
MAGVIAAGRWCHGSVHAADKELPVLGTVPAFQFHDQDDQLVSHATFRGSPWVADFIFTRCSGQCPIMTAKMAAMQNSLPPQVKCVSFSLDPEYDTPAVLKAYAREFSADGLRWKFLTGDSDAMLAQARGMLLTAIPATADQPIIHDGRFVLIDARGRIRGAYYSNEPQALADLSCDAKRLVAEEEGGSRLDGLQ